MLENRHILITGAAGSVGSELVRQLVDKNNVYCLDINETELFELVEELRLKGKTLRYKVGDICHREVFEEIKQTFLPDTIFHAAARKHVAPSEQDPVQAVRINVFGLQSVINFARKNQSRVINISTDKAAGPRCVMGMTKRIGEIMIKNAGFVSVRFANVLGSRGSVIPIWQRQVDQGEPITITDPRMERYFMTIEQAVSLVIRAAEIGQPGEIYVLDMGQPIKILALAEEVIKASGREISIREIGIKPGESLSERLMTDEESQKAERVENFYVIR